MNAYENEAREKWGHTQAYAEYAAKGAGFPGSAQQMMDLFAEIGEMKQLPPEDEAVQQKIAALQAFITDHFYTCTKEILSGLGQMYVSDDRFRKNIDQAGGKGTAAFAKRAIEIYCRK